MIPQAWQNFALGAEKLFDARTMTLCPSGHRNVHYWLVRMMKQESEDPIVLMDVLGFRGRVPTDAHIAVLGIQRWIESGRTLAPLRSRRLYGYA